MHRRILPAVDRSIAPLNGVSREGQPLSYNRAPAADLAPWIARLYATVVYIPASYRLECGLFNDTAFLRIQLGGEWKAETINGPLEYSRAALFFGPHSRRMPVSVRGSFASVGVALRPGAGHALYRAKVTDFVDRIVTCEDIGLSSSAVLGMIDEAADPEVWFTALENMVRQMVESAKGARPDPISARFEGAAFLDPTISIADFARDCGIEQRRLERLIHRDFGMAPKQVLRRARALDMASHLRGVADQAEAEELALRYYDQSHLIRDFTDLFGMSPSQFVANPQPILTLALESRQARRLELIDRLAPGELRPWQ